jgi:2-keto-4-pentenoate hydratase/2-oxohepta-3-ene-1,7-dioic acid hydratase in catechol pathway
LIEIASGMYTLYPGDLIFTGTPEGVGPIRDGDLLIARCTGIGEMQVRIRAGARV